MIKLNTNSKFITIFIYSCLAVSIAFITFFSILSFVIHTTNTTQESPLVLKLVYGEGDAGGDAGGPGDGGGDTGGGPGGDAGGDTGGSTGDAGGDTGGPGGDAGGDVGGSTGDAGGDTGTGSTGDAGGDTGTSPEGDAGGDTGTPPGDTAGDPTGPDTTSPGGGTSLPPTCTLTASQVSIVAGQNVTYTWTTTNADTLVADLGIGALPLNGTAIVTPPITTTITITATGAGGSVQCVNTVVVTPATTSTAPTCDAFTASPSSLTSAGLVTLSWNTTSATSVSINNGVGSVAVDGSASVNVTANTTYTLTATGAGGTVTCTRAVTVTPVVAPSAPTCDTFTASPTSLSSSGIVTLSWNTTGATSVSINNGVGSVAVDGSANTFVTTDTTYTLTATGAGGTVTCTRSVTIVPVVTPGAPTCDAFIAAPSSMSSAGSATLMWNTTGATSVSINNGVGIVAVDGITSVSVLTSTTYTLTASNGTLSSTCVATVTITPTTTSAPTCDAFTASPSTLSSAGPSTLSWDTTGATSVSISGGVGSVAVDGSIVVAVSADTTYTLIATGAGGTVACTRAITITSTPPPTGGPTCDAFTASPSSLAAAGTSTLSWSTTDATSVTINNGVGSVAVDGSATVSVSADTTYTLTATGVGGATVTCTRAITIVPIITPPGGPTCDAFTAVPSSISSAGSATLMWNTTGATSVSINNGVGIVAVDGSASVSVSADTTYTLTASGATGTTTCTAAVDISTPPSGGGGGGGGSSSPRCQLSASNQNITLGKSTKLTWKNSNTNDLLLKDSNGKTILDTKKSASVDEDAGSIEVSPTKTTTYTLTALRGSRERECKVTISVVSVASNRMQDTLALSILPYTGFEAGVTLTALFYAAIVLWGMMIAYALVLKRSSHTPAHTKATHSMSTSAVSETHTPAPEINFIPENLPTEDANTHLELDNTSRLEVHAHEQYALISSDALRLIQSQNGEFEEQIETLNRVIALAKARYPKENEWIIINKDRILSLLS